MAGSPRHFAAPLGHGTGQGEAVGRRRTGVVRRVRSARGGRVDLRTQGRTVRRGRLEQLATSERFVVDKSNADDLRDRRFTLADPVNEIVISEDVAAALRELRLLDGDCEQLVFRIRARNDGAVLPATDDGLDS